MTLPNTSRLKCPSAGPVWIVIEVHGDQPLVFLADSREELEAELDACMKGCPRLTVEVPMNVDSVIGHGPVLDELVRLAVRVHRGIDDGSLCDALGRLDVHEALAKLPAGNV